VFEVAVTGEHAFVAAGEGGVWMLDVSDPGLPRVVGWRDTAGRARSIVVEGGLAYVADGQAGLLVLQARWSGLPLGPGSTVASAPTRERAGTAGVNVPRITVFSVAPAEVEPGDMVDLSWEAIGDRATLCPSARFSLFTQEDCWPVPLSGATTFTIPEQLGGNRFIDLILTVDVEGAPDPAVWQTSVALKCDTNWFYSDERPAGICPREVVESHAIAQRFEHGRMIWVEQVGRAVVLEETPLDGDDRWKLVSYARDPLDVDRETLGRALAPAFEYKATWQCDDALPSGGRSWQTCYLRSPEGEVIVLDPLGRWMRWDE
jgi:hypothetical protein